MNASSPRPYCADCARKHLAQAIVLLQEARQGYPSHIWLAIGHMAEAEAEIEGLYRDVAIKIRDCRKQVETNPAETPNLLAVIEEISGRLSAGSQRAGSGCQEETCSLAASIADLEKRIAGRVAAKTIGNAYPRTLRQLNQFLWKNGMPRDIELVKGRGYFYFMGGSSANWSQTGVYTFKLGDLTFSRWLSEYEDLSG